MKDLIDDESIHFRLLNNENVSFLQYFKIILKYTEKRVQEDRKEKSKVHLSETIINLLKKCGSKAEKCNC